MCITVTDPDSLHRFKVTLLPMDKKVQSEPDSTCLEVIRQAGIYLPSDCGGMGNCGKCRVIFETNPSPTSIEMEYLTSEEIEEGIRLACEHKVESDGHIQILMPFGHSKILTHGAIVASEVQIDETPENQYGIAIDIGTTTIVCYLVELETGSQVGVESALNPQMSFGGDVVSRIAYALGGPESVSELQDSLLTKLDQMITALLDKYDISPKSVVRATVVGNTVMHHLLLGLNVYSLSRYPYTPKMRESHITDANALKLNSLDRTQFFVAPNISGFIGGDAVAFILAQRLDEYEGVALGIDVGTNGEIILAKNGNLSCCSAAAGPAFEGAAITNGMRAQIGAIEYISIIDRDKRPKIATIGHTKPEGLCGTAIVDLTYQLWKVGLIDQRGRMGESERIITLENNEKAYIVLKRDEFGGERDILFTQGDLRQVQLAKGAIQAGFTILMDIADVSLSQLDGIYLAGAFGTYLRPESCIGIGLLPNIGIENIVPVGNAAGEGAKLALISTSQKKLMTTISENTRYVELANQPEFSKIFTESTKFPDR